MRFLSLLAVPAAPVRPKKEESAHACWEWGYCLSLYCVYGFYVVAKFGEFGEFLREFRSDVAGWLFCGSGRVGLAVNSCGSGRVGLSKCVSGSNCGLRPKIWPKML